jgi:hypothetical protein
MCFWFGLEILRPIYKRCFLKYGMVSILFDRLSSEKRRDALLRVEKKFLQNWAYRVSKEAEFCAYFKSVQKVWQMGKIFYRKTEFLGTWKI